jgi:hypothetical protein
MTNQQPEATHDEVVEYRAAKTADNLAAEHGASRVGRILRPHALPGCRVATTVAPAHGLKCDDLSHRSSTFKMKA